MAMMCKNRAMAVPPLSPPPSPPPSPSPQPAPAHSPSAQAPSAQAVRTQAVRTQATRTQATPGAGASAEVFRHPGRHRVAVFVMDGVIPFELGIPLRIFGAAADSEEGAPLYEIVTCGVEP